VHTNKFSLKFSLTILLLAAFGPLAFAQTATLDGTVTDPQGAAVVGAQVEVVNVATGQVVRTTTDVRGHWALPAMQAATYRVLVTKEGFRTAVLESVAMNAGVPATVNTKLEIGQLTETVEVKAGAEIVQATDAAVTSTLTGRQVFELPFTSRNALELLVTQPGTQTPTNARSSSINGLPRSAISITIDGMNSQDNYYKNADGFFSYIYTPTDSIEEVTLSTSAAGADSLGQGAAQVKFVTKGGTNTWRGGAFWQHRNTWFNSNYYFNNINGQPRDRIILNQAGVHAGGPIKKDKLFIFTNYEIYRLPNTYDFTRTVLGDDARKGIFTYQDSSKQVRQVNLYQLAAAANQSLPAGTRPYPTTPDPILADTFSEIAGLMGNGVLRDRIATNNDYNRMSLRFQPNSMQKRYFLTSRIDYNLTDAHHLSFVYNYNYYLSAPDGLNSVVPAYPGTGVVLGTNLITGQRSNRFMGTLTLRSTLSARVTNELRAGLNGGSVLFRDDINPGYFQRWQGYVPNFGSGWVYGITSTSTPSRRNSPRKEVADTVSWLKDAHQISVGFSFSNTALWQQSISSQQMPTMYFGMSSLDPMYTSVFNTKNFPGATSTQLSDAGTLYAILTGRVSSITSSVALDEKTKKYGPYPAVNRDRQREIGLFAQDTWRLRPNFTLTAGLRYEHQFPWENLNGTYSRVGIDGIWGLSGVGNLFAPGVMTGIEPAYLAVTSSGDAYKIPGVWSPSLGFAWRIPQYDGILGKLFGSHEGASVIRAGYAISTIRDSSATFTSIWASNTGRTYSTSISPSSYPQDFGPAGSVLFRDGAFPTRSGVPAAPEYPIPAEWTSSLNDFDPNLKLGYVQSWNIGFQREITPDTVMEVRYTGNHGLKQWRQYNLNEVNIYENGFVKEFAIAQKNLAINRLTSTTTNDFGNKGLPGQGDVPILLTALNTTNDRNIATFLMQNRAGSAASSIATDQTRMNRLWAAGYPKNFFFVNPTVSGGDTYLMTNNGSSFYNALQVEVRRRMSAGLLLQGSYAWSHSLANGATNNLYAADQPTTLRNLRLNRNPSGYDIRHAFKLNWIYELPFGPGRHFASGVGNLFLRKAIEGWEIAGVSRIQSGTPTLFTSGRSGTINTQEGGIVLHNITAKELQSLMKIRKTTGADGKGIVYGLPQSFIDNTMAAFEVGGKTLADLDPNSPYAGPSLDPGVLGNRIYLYAPWLYRTDLSLVKITKFAERGNVEFRVQALNAFNLTGFYGPTLSGASSSLGQIGSAYRDSSGTVDPGGRIIEFVLRVNF
jgi:hypothetical protein